VEQSRKLINNPGRLDGEAQIELCGSCHRKPPAKGQTFTWDNPWFTRHQTMYLSQSACFKQSNGALSCTTCHDPLTPSGATHLFTTQGCVSSATNREVTRKWKRLRWTIAPAATCRRFRRDLISSSRTIGLVSMRTATR